MPHAVFHDIRGCHRASDFADRVTPKDFDLGAAQSVDAAIVVSDSNWSLAGLDLDAGNALFLRLPPDIDLSKAAFVHMAQSAKANALLTVPVDDLLDLSRALPAPKRLIFLFSTGRCGTTLASRILGQVPGVYSLSEPDPFMALALARFTLPPARQLALVEALTRFSFRPPHGSNATTLALKFQSQVLFQAALFHQAFPKAINIFQYRDTSSWNNSMSHFMQMLGLPTVLPAEVAQFAWRMAAAATPWEQLGQTADLTAPAFTHVEVNTPAWALHIKEYQRLTALGLPFMALRYNELNSDHLGSTARLLAHCGLPAAHLDTALQAFDQDSQEGTQISRDHRVANLAAADYDRQNEILASLPGNLGANVILADSLG